MALEKQNVVRDILWNVANELINLAVQRTAEGIHVLVVLKARDGDHLAETVSLRTWVREPPICNGFDIDHTGPFLTLQARWHAARIQFLDSCRLTIDEQMSKERQALARLAPKTEEPL